MDGGKMQAAVEPGGLLAEYMEPEALASDLGVTVRTLERWHRRGWGPPRVTIGRRVLYRRAAVAAWVQANEVDPAERRRRRR